MLRNIDWRKRQRKGMKNKKSNHFYEKPVRPLINFECKYPMNVGKTSMHQLKNNIMSVFCVSLFIIIVSMETKMALLSCGCISEQYATTWVTTIHRTHCVRYMVFGIPLRSSTNILISQPERSIWHEIIWKSKNIFIKIYV